MAEIPFNINFHVKVKLTPYGRERLKKDHEDFWKHVIPKTAIEYKPPREDDEGWSRWQLWSLMKKIGPYMSLGNEEPIHMNIIIITEDV